MRANARVRARAGRFDRPRLHRRRPHWRARWRRLPDYGRATGSTPDRWRRHCRSIAEPGSGSRRNPHDGGRNSRHGSGIHSSPRKRWKAADSSQIQPNGRDCTLSNVSPGMTRGGMAGQHEAGRVDQHQRASPAAHAGFRIARIVIGRHEIDAHAALQPLPVRAHRSHAASQLPARGQQLGRDSRWPSHNIARWRFPGDPRPAVRPSPHIESSRSRFWRCTTAFKVNAMRRCPNEFRQRQFAGMRRRAGELIGGLFVTRPES